MTNFDIRFYEELYFYFLPLTGKAYIIIKDVNKNIIYENELDFDEYPIKWIHVYNLHKFNELYVELYKDNKLIYNKLFFKYPELSYIDKKDITIILNVDKKIEDVIEYYSKYANIEYDSNISNINTKYVLVLNKYVLNIVQILNNMFFNYDKILKTSDQNILGGTTKYFYNNNNEMIIDNVEYLNEEVW